MRQLYTCCRYIQQVLVSVGRDGQAARATARYRGRAAGRTAYTLRIVASAHAIRVTAVSGGAPNSPATCTAQPPTPNRRSVVSTVARTSPAAARCEGGNEETNSASARN